MTEPTALHLYRSLTAPWTQPYTTDDARARARDLLRLYAMAEAEPEVAAILSERARRSFWVYLCLFGWTFDPKSGGKMRVKPFAPRNVYKVLSDFADERNEDGTWKHPTLFVSKSRQLMLSWWSIHRLAWSAQSAEFGEYPVISKTEDDARELMRRLRVSHQSYPAFYRASMRAFPASCGAGDVEYSNGSRIWAMAQRGGDAARGAVPTMYLFDEAAFQTDFEKNYQAIRGTAFTAQTQGLVVSTAQVSPWWDLVSDAMDGRHGGRGQVYHESEGIQIYANAINQIDVVRIHYTAYEERRRPEWIAQAKRGVPIHVWRQEFEIDPHARGGAPVFSMLSRDAHMMRRQPRVIERGGAYYIVRPSYCDPKTMEPFEVPVTLIRAIDHGTNGYFACTWHAITMDKDRDWIVYRSFRRTGKGVTANARDVALLSAGERYKFDVIDAMDRTPEGTGQVYDLYNRYQHDDGTKPFRGLTMARKGAGSRQEGVEAIQAMMLSTLAVEQPGAQYWADQQYDEGHRKSFWEHSGLYISPTCEDLFNELDMARYDERKGVDAALLNKKETTVDMVDDLIDTVRYAIRAGGHLMRTKRAD